MSGIWESAKTHENALPDVSLPTKGKLDSTPLSEASTAPCTPVVAFNLPEVSVDVDAVKLVHSLSSISAEDDNNDGEQQIIPTSSELQAILEEAKVLYDHKFGTDVQDGCEDEGGITWTCTVGSGPLTISVLEDKLTEVKRLFEQRFGHDVDSESDFEDYFLDEDGTAWTFVVGTGTPMISALEDKFDAEDCDHSCCTQDGVSDDEEVINTEDSDSEEVSDRESVNREEVTDTEDSVNEDASSEDSDDVEVRTPLLESFDLDGIAKYILENEVKNVVVMCGAGISTSAGIPDFRTPGSGLYDNLKRFDLPEPEAIFTLDYFKEKPEAFYELCRDMWPGNYKPTPCHYFIRLLHEKGLLRRCYTQNIDSLEQQAGLPPEKIVAAHGNFDTAHVVDDLGIDDSVEVDLAELKQALDEDGSAGWEALREWHGGLVKPKIVFFGEDLPPRFFELHKDDLQDCDLLLVMGTSLVVQPFASLLGYASTKAPRMLINRNPSGKEEDLPGGFRFHLRGRGRNRRDVWHCSDCDSGVKKLARKLGWASDLHELIVSDGAAAVTKAAWAGDVKI